MNKLMMVDTPQSGAVVNTPEGRGRWLDHNQTVTPWWSRS
jgi:hypothetical protein